MPFVKGQVANPKGRPKKGRALTDILTKTGSKKSIAILRDGITVYRDAKHIMAEMIWTGIATGIVTFPDGTTRKIEDFADWLSLVKFVYQHIDGPPPTQLDLTTDGQPLKAYIGITPDDWDGEGGA